MRAGKPALRAAVFAGIPVWVQTASGQSTGILGNPTCFGCHDVTGFEPPRADGQMHSLFVGADDFAGSVHGKALRCIDHHTTITGLSRKNGSKAPAERERTWLAITRNCFNCHAGPRRVAPGPIMAGLSLWVLTMARPVPAATAAT
jgi:hypothetical protein